MALRSCTIAAMDSPMKGALTWPRDLPVQGSRMLLSRNTRHNNRPIPSPIRIPHAPVGPSQPVLQHFPAPDTPRADAIFTCRKPALARDHETVRNRQKCRHYRDHRWGSGALRHRFHHSSDQLQHDDNADNAKHHLIARHRTGIPHYRRPPNRGGFSSCEDADTRRCCSRPSASSFPRCAIL